MSPEANVDLIKVLFDDGCNGCVNSWLIPNLGWILFFIIFVLPFLTYLLFCFISELFGKMLGIPKTPIFERRGGGVNRLRYGTCPWKHGDKVCQKTLEELLENKPGREGYWDSYKNKLVYDLKDLTPRSTGILFKD